MTIKQSHTHFNGASVAFATAHPKAFLPAHPTASPKRSIPIPYISLSLTFVLVMSFLVMQTGVVSAYAAGEGSPDSIFERFENTEAVTIDEAVSAANALIASRMPAADSRPMLGWQSGTDTDYAGPLTPLAQPGSSQESLGTLIRDSIFKTTTDTILPILVTSIICFMILEVSIRQLRKVQ
ncbi:MAG: hypothetical protein LBD25_08190 [Coriobacteriales bacterium]|jgi:hypothetical protein|nr:hypothetical protein [Coriobacteriales bacterium]